VSLQEDMPRKVNRVWASQPLDRRGGDSNPPRPPRPLGLFGLPMVNPKRQPLPPNRPYHWPLNYHKYVKDFDPDAYVRVFKVAIRANSEINDVKIVNMFNFPLKILCLTSVTIIWEITKLQLAFCKRYRKV